MFISIGLWCIDIFVYIRIYSRHDRPRIAFCISLQKNAVNTIESVNFHFEIRNTRVSYVNLHLQFDIWCFLRQSFRSLVLYVKIRIKSTLSAIYYVRLISDQLVSARIAGQSDIAILTKMNQVTDFKCLFPSKFNTNFSSINKPKTARFTRDIIRFHRFHSLFCTVVFSRNERSSLAHKQIIFEVAKFFAYSYFRFNCNYC